MKGLGSAARSHPILFVLGLTLVWLASMLILSGLGSGLLGLPYGSAEGLLVGRLSVTLIVLLFLFRLGWLEEAGFARWGRAWIWLITLLSFVYVAVASLYAFFGRLSFDFLSLIRTPAVQFAVVMSFAAALSEETMFRGVVLRYLVRVWGATQRGLLAAAVVTALLFAALHAIQLLTNALSLHSAVLLILQTTCVSIWWAALVLRSGSILPAVMLHFLGNAVVSSQVNSIPMLQPETLSYTRLLWFSIPLAFAGLGLLVRARSVSLSRQKA